MSENNQPSKQIITVQLDQLDWPEVLNECFPHEILKWLISDDLSAAALEVAANARIRIIPKPRSRKDVYLVAGGFLPFLQLLTSGWADSIECIMDQTIAPTDLKKYFYLDVCHSIFPVKSGPLATAAKSAIFIKLMDLGESVGAPSCFKLSARHLSNGKRLLKQLTGFDPRSYKRCDKSGASDSLLLTIEDVLGISCKQEVEAIDN